MPVMVCEPAPDRRQPQPGQIFLPQQRFHLLVHCPREDQDHGQKLGAHEHEKPGRIEEREDQEEHGVYRVARRYHHHGRGDGHGGEEVKCERL